MSQLIDRPSLPTARSASWVSVRRRAALRERRLVAALAVLRSHREDAPSPGLDGALGDLEARLRDLRRERPEH